MNIRKPVDYSAMYTALDMAFAANLPQMELYCEIGHIVSARPEKGAAVMAAEYLQERVPGYSGFSPRNLRRMREFYRTYMDAPAIMEEAMLLGWTQNVVIFEAELTIGEKAWYIRSAAQLGWSKKELIARIAEHEHEKNILDAPNILCCPDNEDTEAGNSKESESENTSEAETQGQDASTEATQIAVSRHGLLFPLLFDRGNFLNISASERHVGDVDHIPLHKGIQRYPDAGQSGPLRCGRYFFAAEEEIDPGTRVTASTACRTYCFPVPGERLTKSPPYRNAADYRVM